jgi:HAD superfamily hydrolase (TIGR01484 family)
MVPIANMTKQSILNVKYVLMDIDDTITNEGKLPSDAYAALWQLAERGFHVIPVTGRPAGWCDLIARQWPVAAVVGENGALVFWEELGVIKRLYHPNAVDNGHPVLQRVRERILREVPGTRLASDQFARMFDLAFDFREEEPRLPLSDAVRMRGICEEEGAVAKISSIHVNVWMGDYSKLSMVTQWLHRTYSYEDGKKRDSVLFFGDSPNDEPMFSHFPLTVGVANILQYGHLMTHLPKYVTESDGGHGFSEGVTRLLSLL